MEVGEPIVGFVYLDVERKAAFKLAVDPKCRGVDHGKRLMDAVEAKARILNWERLLVGVMDSKQRLIPYYQRLGYAETGEHNAMDASPGYAGPAHYFIILSKRLREEGTKSRMRVDLHGSNALESRKEAARRKKHKRDVVMASRRRNRRKK